MRPVTGGRARKETGLVPPATGRPARTGMALTHGVKGSRYRTDLPGVNRLGSRPSVKRVATARPAASGTRKVAR